MPVARSCGSRQKCASVWLDFSNMNSKRVLWSLGDARKAGRHDTAFHWYYSFGTCSTTASTSFFGVIGFADAANVLGFPKPNKIISHEVDLAIQWSHR